MADEKRFAGRSLTANQIFRWLGNRDSVNYRLNDMDQRTDDVMCWTVGCRVALVVAGAMFVATSCSFGEPVDPQVSVAVAEDSPSVLSGLPSAEEVDCVTGLVQEGEAGMTDENGPTSFASLEDAADDYWKNGDGKFRSDRGELTETLAPPIVLYKDDQGRAQVILDFEEVDAGWVFVHSVACMAEGR